MYLLNDSSYADRILHTRKYIDICFPALHSFGSIKSQKTTINYTLGRFKILFCLAKMTLKLSKSVETGIITDMGLDTPPHEKPPEINLQNITRNISQTTTNQLMTPMSFPKLSNCRFRVSGQDG